MKNAIAAIPVKIQPRTNLADENSAPAMIGEMKCRDLVVLRSHVLLLFLTDDFILSLTPE